MSRNIRLLAALGLVAALAACAQSAPEEEFVVVEPISVEPVQTGKYK